jgi:hypothetical protein
VLTCLAQGFDAGRAIADGAAGTHVPRLEAALDLASTTSSCGTAVNESQRIAAVAGFTSEELLDAMRSPFWDEAETLFDLAGRHITPFRAA